VRRRSGAALLAAVCAAVALLGSGCAASVDGQAFASATVTAGIDPGFVKGTDGGEDDRLAAAVLRDLEGWWSVQFPKLANGGKFTPLKGYFSVDSSRDGPGPPCTDAASDVEGNAFYCPSADIIAYDRAALLPVLRQKFGDSAVAVVLAHEFGHSIQQRLESSSPTAAGLSSGAPTILSEGQADCYAGGFLRAVHDGATPDLRTGDAGISAAMNALITFRDPVGTDAGDDRAHGNAFDRVSSFQEGYDGGPATCAGMTLRNRTFTQQSFATLSDAQSGGNLPLPDLLRSMGTDLDRYFGGLVGQRGGRWTPPTIREGSAGCGPDAVDFCPGNPPTLAVNDRALTTIHDGIGDYASGTVLASRYALAAMAALGRPTTGAQAGTTALCLAGAYTGDVGKPGTDFSLSPGDLDEAIGLLQRDDSAARGTDGVSAPGGAYARIEDFRSGVTGGDERCLGA
jgi:predicted metalloprotease